MSKDQTFALAEPFQVTASPPCFEPEHADHELHRQGE